MSEKTVSFLQLAEASKSYKTNMDKISSLIDWNLVEVELQASMNEGLSSATEKLAYPALTLFKCLVIQRMYNLSDSETVYQIADRFSFMRFVDIGNPYDVPDAATICRFRNELVGQEACDRILDNIIEQINKKGEFKMGIIADPAIIPNPPWSGKKLR